MINALETDDISIKTYVYQVLVRIKKSFITYHQSFEFLKLFQICGLQKTIEHF